MQSSAYLDFNAFAKQQIDVPLSLSLSCVVSLAHTTPLKRVGVLYSGFHSDLCRLVLRPPLPLLRDRYCRGHIVVVIVFVFVVFTSCWRLVFLIQTNSNNNNNIQEQLQKCCPLNMLHPFATIQHMFLLSVKIASHLISS